MKYRVFETMNKSYIYTVEASSEEEAVEIAKGMTFHDATDVWQDWDSRTYNTIALSKE